MMQSPKQKPAYNRETDALNANAMQRTEITPNLSELELGYYGWRVVFAACLGVMAGFGSLFVYTFSVFVKPTHA